MDEGTGDIAHPKEAFVGDFFVDEIDDSKELEFVLLDLGAELVEGEDDPLQLLLTDGVPEDAHPVGLLQQV
jgi:hypothetical protein